MRKQVMVLDTMLLPKRRPALQTLGLSGGFSAYADREMIVVMRPRGKDAEVHVFSGATPGPDGNVLIQAEDIVFVRRIGAGRFVEQVMPYLDAALSFTGTFSNIVFPLKRLEDR